jgi:pseudoazurin
MPTKVAVLSALVGSLVWLSVAANAAEFEVKMLNKGSDGTPMAFEPAMITIEPGDTVHFIATDKGHDALSIPGMIPEGAESFEGKISQDVSVTFTVPGVYGYKCRPHYALGMVGLVVVGESVNLDAAMAVRHVGKAKKVFAELFEGL